MYDYESRMWARFLEQCSLTHSATFGENQTQYISTNTSYRLSSMVVEGWCFGLPPTGPNPVFYPDSELLFHIKAIGPTAKAGSRPIHATHRYASKSTIKWLKIKNQDVVMAQSPARILQNINIWYSESFKWSLNLLIWLVSN